MGKVVASYLVKVTLREPELFDAPPPGGDMFPPKDIEPPSNENVAEAVAAVLGTTGLVAHATSERTDI